LQDENKAKTDLATQLKEFKDKQLVEPVAKKEEKDEDKKASEAPKANA